MGKSVRGFLQKIGKGQSARGFLRKLSKGKSVRGFLRKLGKGKSVRGFLKKLPFWHVGGADLWWWCMSPRIFGPRRGSLSLSLGYGGVCSAVCVMARPLHQHRHRPFAPTFVRSFGVTFLLVRSISVFWSLPGVRSVTPSPPQFTVTVCWVTVVFAPHTAQENQACPLTSTPPQCVLSINHASSALPLKALL